MVLPLPLWYVQLGWNNAVDLKTVWMCVLTSESLIIHFYIGPMLSDLVNLDELLDEISFDENLGAPLKPFEQLMGCMPPSQAHHLPEPYRWLMRDPASPIIDFYPKTFTIDMNGKRWPWEAVALLPFIDSSRLLEVAGKVDDSMLLEEERERNSTGTAVVMMHDPEYAETVPGIGEGKVFETIEENKTRIIPFDVSDWNYKSEEVPVLKAQLAPGVTVPLSGFGSLRDGPVQSLWRRKMGINVFGSRSRYKTACLEISKFMPPLPPIEALGPKLIGTCIYVNYPYFIEGLVTAVSDENVLIRGKNEPRRWTAAETERWQISRDGVTRRYETGEGYTGTGGVTIPEDQTILISVRPFEDLVTAKDGTQVKSYAKFEIEVPLMSTFWVPSHPDPRLSAVPSRLEKNAFDVATPIHKIGLQNNKNSADSKPRKLFPSKTRKSSLFEPPNLQTAQGGLTESSPSNSPTIRAFSADQRDRPEEIVASPASLLPDGQPLSVSSISAEQVGLLPVGQQSRAKNLRKGAVTSRKFSSVHTPDDRDMFLDAPAVVSRLSNIDFASKIKSLEPLPGTALRGLASVEHTRQATPAVRQCPRTASHSNTSGLHSSRPSAAALRGGNSRVRILAVGAATAAFVFSSAGASRVLPSLFGFKRDDTKTGLVSGHFQASEPFFPGPEDPMNLDIVDFVGDILSVRGGDFEKSEDASSSTPPLEFAHGTTTISFTFKDGIVAAVDSRASMGSFVGSKTTQKVLPVNSHMLGTMAGGAADCMFWIRKVKAEAMQHELTEGRRMSVARASRILSNFLYQNRGVGLSMGTMIMGFDQDGPPRIYYVDDSGVRIEGSQFGVGSGASFALGILDTERREEMTEEEAVALGIKAVRHATFRDAYSGGFINVFVITKDGWRKVFTEDLARTSQISRDDGIESLS
jgi:20S proteasome subunit beta 5